MNATWNEIVRAVRRKQRRRTMLVISLPLILGILVAEGCLKGSVSMKTDWVSGAANG